MTEALYGATAYLMAPSLCSSYYFILMFLIKHVMGSEVKVESRQLKMF